MIFFDLFFTFLKIGIFTFGGGYGMIAIIQNEVVYRHAWLTATEFTDILAVSQMTPGPIGINTATYTGYMAVLHAGYASWLAVLGSLVASFAVILLPALLMMMVLRFLLRHSGNRDVQNVLSMLSIVVVGLIAAAALSLVSPTTFGTPGLNRQFVVSLFIFAAVFILSLLPRQFNVNWFGQSIGFSRPSPIVLLLASALVGLLL
ncbi:MAG: chromate transporter [Bacteroidales bacterium]|nr:chromate transporter [Bacteroidales bacterium]